MLPACWLVLDDGIGQKIGLCYSSAFEWAVREGVTTCSLWETLSGPGDIVYGRRTGCLHSALSSHPKTSGCGQEGSEGGGEGEVLPTTCPVKNYIVDLSMAWWEKK